MARSKVHLTLVLIIQVWDTDSQQFSVNHPQKKCSLSLDYIFFISRLYLLQLGMGLLTKVSPLSKKIENQPTRAA